VGGQRSGNIAAEPASISRAYGNSVDSRPLRSNVERTCLLKLLISWRGPQQPVVAVTRTCDGLTRNVALDLTGWKQILQRFATCS